MSDRAGDDECNPPPTFRVGRAIDTGSAECTEHIATIARRGRVSSCGPFGPTPDQLAFSALVKATTPAERLRLLEHESPALRGYLITHVVASLRDELERLEPLFHDDRTLETQYGCFHDTPRVGVHLARQLAYLAAVDPPWRDEPVRPERERAWAALVRAAGNNTVPTPVRAAVLREMAMARVHMVLPALRDALVSDEPALLVVALDEIERLPRRERPSVLHALLGHRSSTVRERALAAVQRLGLPRAPDASI